MSNTILVTGGLGMLGVPTCRALVHAGHTPVIFDPGTDRSQLAEVANLCAYVQGTVDHLPEILAAIRQYQPIAVIHLAARVGINVETDLYTTVQSNLMGTINILEAARLSDIERVVLTSSKTVYGPVPEPFRAPEYRPVPEDLSRDPTSFYGRLKRAAEDIASHYASAYALDVMALRFGATYGPTQPGRHKVPVVQMIDAALAGTPWHVDHGAEQMDDMCYCGEVGNAVTAALRAPESRGQFRAFNISGDELLSLTEMIRILQEINPAWEASAGPGMDYRDIGVANYFKMDVRKARSDLGFEPAFRFELAVKDYSLQVKSLRR